MKWHLRSSHSFNAAEERVVRKEARKEQPNKARRSAFVKSHEASAWVLVDKNLAEAWPHDRSLTAAETSNRAFTGWTNSSATWVRSGLSMTPPPLALPRARARSLDR